MFFPDKKKAYQEAYRVLAGGGRYLFSVWDPADHNPINRLVTNIAAGFCAADPPRIFQVPVAYHRIDPVRDLLDTVGFTDINISVVSIQKTIAHIAALTQSQVYGGPLLDELRARDVDPDRVVDALAEALPRAFGSNPTHMPLQAIVFEARRP